MRIERLSESPGLGPDCSFVSEGIRRFPSQSHTVYYRPIPGGIRVLRILHARMDPLRHIP